jgi:hypothetical protein
MSRYLNVTTFDKLLSELDLLRDGWAMQGDCYLERFHPRGVPTSTARGRVYSRE